MQPYLKDGTPLSYRHAGRDYCMEVARGLIRGHQAVNKFGKTVNADSGIETDIWRGADAGTATYVAPTQARTHACESSSVDDTGVLRIWGLQDWGTRETSEDVILTGQTPVNTANSYVIIHRAEMRSALNVGLITITANTDSSISAYMPAGVGRTQMVVYGVPSTQTLYIRNIYASILKGTNVDANITLWVTPDVESDETFFSARPSFGVAQSGTNHGGIRFDYPLALPGPCIVKMSANADTNDSTIQGGFSGELVDNV